MRPLEIFFSILIGTMVISFFINLGITDPDMGKLFYGLAVPTIPGGS